MRQSPPRSTFIIAGLVALFALVALLPSAHAHANVAGSLPGFGERLERSPELIQIRFTEPVDPALTEITILNGSFVTFPVGAVELRENGFLLRVPIPDPLPPGGYVVKWEVISTADGHKTFGAIPFGVGTNATLAGGSDGAVGVRVDAAIGKAAAFLGLSLSAGVFGFWYLVLPRGLRKGHEEVLERLGLWGAWAHVLGVGLFAFSQWQIADVSFAEYFARTSFGQGIVWRMIFGLAIVAGFRYALSKDDIPRGLWATLAVVIGLTFVMYGRFSHTAALIQPLWMGILADAVHLAFVGLWAGGLVAFVVVLHDLPHAEGELAEYLRQVPKRFSDYATISVIAVSLTGIFMLWATVGFTTQGWFTDPYQMLLGIKILLAIVMIVLGGYNKLVFVARYVREGGIKTVRAFRENVRREAVIGAVVFLLAGILTNLSPPFAATDADDDIDFDSPYIGLQDRLTIVNESTSYEWTVQFHPAPALNEPTHFIVNLFHLPSQTQDTEADFVRILLANQDRPDLGQTVIRTNLTQSGTYDVTGTFFTFPGDWQVTFEVQSGHNNVYRESVVFAFEL